MRGWAASLALVGACCCVATVLVAGGLATYLWASGTLSPQSLQAIVAILRHEPAVGAAAELPAASDLDNQQPSYAEQRAAYDTRALDLDFREQALDRRRELLRSELATLSTDSQRWRREKQAFEKQLAELQEAGRGSGRDNLRLILEELKPRQAKDQILHMLAAKQSAEVAALLLDMPGERRAKIIGEFKTPEEMAGLDEVLKAIRVGDPQASLIDQTLERSRQ